MSETDVVLRLGVALIVGLGIGVERGFSHHGVPDDLRATGVRTFAFLALIGAACGLSIPFAGPWLLAAVGLGVIGFLIAAYRAGLARSPDIGLTTEMAAVTTFVAGALSGAGYPFATVLTGAAAILLLHNKPALHRLTGQIDRNEIDAGIKVVVLAALAVPLAPDRGFGPGEAINPRELALAVAIIAALGLAGYAAIRILGSRLGLLAFGFFGGLVSSTGVTIGAAKLAQEAPGHSGRLAAAASVAQTVMFARTGLLAGALNPSLLPSLAWPLAAGMTAAGVAAWVLMQPSKTQNDSIPLGSPDTMNAAARFVALAAAVILASAFLIEQFGVWALYAGGFLAGLVDVDASTLTAARLSGGDPGAYAVVLALSANALSKTTIAWRLGGRDMGLKAGYALMGSGLAAAAAFAATLALR
jgi:uncharacterized membrane protein (DUF4010 family)